VNDPERWLSSPDAPGNMQELLARARAEAPEAAVVERLASRLSTDGPRPGVAWLPRLGGLLLLGGVIAFVVARGGQSESTPGGGARPPTERARLEPPIALPPTTRARSAGPTAESKNPDVPAVEPARSPIDAKPSELTLVRGAREALAARPAASLQLLDQHLRLYPHGKLAEEREVLAIDALRRVGRANTADQRQARFIANHPASAHRSRLERKAQLASESPSSTATYDQ